MVPRPALKLSLATFVLLPLAALPFLGQAPQRDDKPSETGAMPPEDLGGQGHRPPRVARLRRAQLRRLLL